MFKRSLILFLCIICSSCGTSVFENHENDYLNEKTIEPLRIPHGLSSDTIHASYPVSDRVYPPIKEKMDVTPPGL